MSSVVRLHAWREILTAKLSPINLAQILDAPISEARACFHYLSRTPANTQGGGAVRFDAVELLLGCFGAHLVVHSQALGIKRYPFPTPTPDQFLHQFQRVVTRRATAALAMNQHRQVDTASFRRSVAQRIHTAWDERHARLRSHLGAHHAEPPRRMHGFADVAAHLLRPFKALSRERLDMLFTRGSLAQDLLTSPRDHEVSPLVMAIYALTCTRVLVVGPGLPMYEITAGSSPAPTGMHIANTSPPIPESHLTANQAAIVELARRGCSVENIAATKQCSRVWVYSTLKAAGVETPGRVRAAKRRAKLLAKHLPKS